MLKRNPIFAQRDCVSEGMLKSKRGAVKYCFFQGQQEKFMETV